MSRAFPRQEDAGVIERFELGIDNITRSCYAIHGSPAQAVAHAVLEITAQLPSLCVSGINNGENLGTALFISGTIGAALEASSYGIPALAISAKVKSPVQYPYPFCRQDWEVPVHFTRKFASFILQHGLPPGVALLNVNIPSDAKFDTEARTTCQSRQNYFVFEKPKKRDFSVNFKLPVKVKIDHDTLELDSDIYAFVVDSVVSVTPIGTDLSVRGPSGAPVGINC
jgi:5'-nucleotidase